MYWVHIWLRARRIGSFTWVELYTSDSGQFCLSYNLNIFFSWFSITIFFICMNSLRYKKIYTTFFIIWFYNFQYSQDVQFMFILFSLVQKIIRIFRLWTLKKTQSASKLNIIQSCAEGNNIYIKCTFWLCWKLKVGFVRLDSGREPDLSGSESDMYTVHARSKICPCLPTCTR